MELLLEEEVFEVPDVAMLCTLICAGPMLPGPTIIGEPGEPPLFV